MPNETNSRKFGANIRKIRQGQKLSITQLADLSGVNKNTICNVEKGGHKASFDTIYKISKALDVDPVALMESKTTDYILKRQNPTVKQTIYMEGKRTSRISAEESLCYHVKDTQVRLENGNQISGIVEVHPEGMHEMGIHDGEELFFCLAGKIKVTINDEEVHLKKGDCVAFWGYEPHKYQSETEGVSVGLSVISGSGALSITDLHDNKK